MSLNYTQKVLLTHKRWILPFVTNQNKRGQIGYFSFGEIHGSLFFIFSVFDTIINLQPGELDRLPLAPAYCVATDPQL